MKAYIFNMKFIVWLIESLNMIKQNMIDVLIALGSNMGDSKTILHHAIGFLQTELHDISISSCYRTKAKYVEQQADFYNMVVTGKTNQSANILLKRLKAYELVAGRRPTIRNGPRILDLDIIFYGDQQIDNKQLTIPHAAYHERGFVLLPACDIAADWICPVRGLTLQSLRDLLPASEHNSIIKEVLNSQ